MKKQILLLTLCTAACLLTACTRQTEHAGPTDQFVLTEEQAYSLEDGAVVSLWTDTITGRILSYRLEDGTILLEYLDNSGQDMTAALLDSISELTNQAMEKILTFYDDPELPFDIETLIQEAYEDYTLCAGEGGRFRTHSAGTEITLTAVTPRFAALLFTARQPENPRFDGTVTEQKTPALFDLSTGETIDMWDTFQLPPDEAKEYLLSLCGGIAKPDEMKAAIDSAYLLWFPEELEIWFPAGTLTSQSITAGGGFSYEELEGFLQPWAVQVSED